MFGFLPCAADEWGGSHPNGWGRSLSWLHPETQLLPCLKKSSFPTTRAGVLHVHNQRDRKSNRTSIAVGGVTSALVTATGCKPRPPLDVQRAKIGF